MAPPAWQWQWRPAAPPPSMIQQEINAQMLREINQMEREMCQYLEWELNVDPATHKEFEEMKLTLPPSAIPFPPTCVMKSLRPG
ncbi:hypothetical protein SCLCIDRAFT_31929 [Scleroderma citrinum Foug A]|uniref:Cyclin N-terminal domain-containing protein n=1 Tax=Scleroderma citrinum Foug A TaxID=1036808 RepID=A0A0C3DAG5_9AGAM|nr:hypothetical protein SCLCIDRAFT_31929 [Scleroderma citrinum Foug A]